MSKRVKSLIIMILVILTIIFYFLSQIPEQLVLENGYYEDEKIILQVYEMNGSIGVARLNKSQIVTSIQSFPIPFSTFSIGGQYSVHNTVSSAFKNGFYITIDKDRYVVTDYSHIPQLNRDERDALLTKKSLKAETYRNRENYFDYTGLFRNEFFAMQVYEQGDKLVIFLTSDGKTDIEVHYSGSTAYAKMGNKQVISTITSKVDDEIIVNLTIDEVEHQIILELPDTIENIQEDTDIGPWKELFKDNIRNN